MYGYGDYVELRVTVKEVRDRKVGSKSVYEIEAKRVVDGKWVPVLQKLSTGQRLLVALSIVMGAAKLRRHNADFIVFDEPVPVLDAECRKAFVKALSSLEAFKQVVIASQDQEFAKVALEVALKRKGYTPRIYTLTWNPGQKEPTIEQKAVV